MKPNFQRLRILLPAASLLFAFSALASGETVDALLRRYPYDPACPWGRIGNGKGLIVRCLTEAEAQGLRSGTLPLPPEAAAVESATPVSGAPPVAATPTAPVKAEESIEPDASPPEAGAQRLEVTVGPVTADSGQLGIGKLGAARDRYLKCVADNGGLKEATGEVQVRFLLRQHGRAEGVSVAKRVGLSAEAARCVSEVVDRRYVGVPEAPIVGATVHRQVRQGRQVSQEAEYRAREQRFNAEAERHAARSRTVSNLRGLSFAVFIVSLLLSVFGKNGQIYGR